MQRAGKVDAPPLPPALKVASYPRPVQRLLEVVARAAAEVMPRGALERLAVKENNARARTRVFAVESVMRALTRRFERRHDKELMLAKGLEDSLGALGHAQDMRAVMTRIGAPKLARYWAGVETARREALNDLLESTWLRDDGGFAKLDAALKNERGLVVCHATHRIVSAEEDMRANAKSLRRECRQVLKKDLDMNDLDQIHELRRTCRWFAILARALNGAVVLEERGEPAAFTHYLTDPASKLEFADLPRSELECHPVRVSRALWIGVGHVIDQLGKIKDDGEAYEGVAEALRATSDLGKKAAHRESLRLLGLTEAERGAWSAEAAKLHAEARELFAAVIDQLTRQIDT